MDPTWEIQTGGRLLRYLLLRQPNQARHTERRWYTGSMPGQSRPTEAKPPPRPPPEPQMDPTWEIQTGGRRPR